MRFEPSPRALPEGTALAIDLSDATTTALDHDARCTDAGLALLRAGTIVVPDPADTAPSMTTLELELSTAPPTVAREAELPDQSGPRYPLVRVPRSQLGVWALLGLWVRLVLWRRAARKHERANAKPLHLRDLGPPGK